MKTDPSFKLVAAIVIVGVIVAFAGPILPTKPAAGTHSDHLIHAHGTE
jgi:hypothetical protein